MDFFKMSAMAFGCALILSACGDDSASSSGTSFSCNVKKSSDSAELEMVFNVSGYSETYTHSAELQDGKIFNKHKYVFSEKEDAESLCRDFKQEGFYKDLSCSGETVSYTHTTIESRADVGRIVEKLDEECDDLEKKYATEEENLNDDDDEDENDDDYGYYDDEDDDE